MKIKARQKTIQIFLGFLFLAGVLSLDSDPLFSQNGDFLHLKKADFDAFFQHKKSRHSFYEDRECRLWHSPFVCWNRTNRLILVPNLRKFPLPKRKFPENLANELENYYRSISASEKSYLIDKIDMMAFSLKYFVENKYHFIKWVKDNCNHPENSIIFYIFDFTADNRMDLYYCLEENSGNLRFITNTISVGDPQCIREWENLLKTNSLNTKIDVEITGLIGNKTLLDVSPSISNIIFSDSKNPSPILYPKVISSIRGGDLPVVKLEFDLSVDRDLELINTSGIWLKNTRIIYSSLYSYILNYFYLTGEAIRNNTFELLFARTSDFDLGKPDLNQNIQNNELPEILSFIIDTIKKRKRKTFIQLIGYADVNGKETNLIRWKNKNVELSKERAEQVKQWLENNLGTFVNNITFETKGCDQEYYNQHDRCVEIKIF